MDLQIWQHRKPLEKMRRALSKGAVTVGFLGGSITDGRPGYNWSDKTVNWLAERYPGVRFTVENAAIGATGSDSAVFRADRDIIYRNCDLVFVEYAVNDYYANTETRKKSREGLLRKLLSEGNCDLILTYTYLQAMYKDMSAGLVPDSIQEFERLAAHYGISSVWMGLYAFEGVCNGSLMWDEWLPDGLHPTHRGSYSYAQSVIAFLSNELQTASGASSDLNSFSASPELPEPIDPLNWERIGRIPFSEVKTTGHWLVHRSSTLVWIDEMLVTSAIGAKLSFSFEGRGLALGFDFGKLSAEFSYRLDGEAPIRVSRDREDWCVNEGWYRFTLLSDNWEWGKHEIELEVIHGDRPECTGTRFKLAFIGVIK